MAKKSILLPLSAIALVLLAIFIVRAITDPEGDGVAEWPSKLQQDYDTAKGIHDSGDWCSAKQLWEDLAQKVESHATKNPNEQLDDLRRIATDNLKFAEQRCEPGEDLISAGDERIKVTKPQGGSEPTSKLTDDDIARHFPIGRVVRSLGLGHGQRA